MGIILEVERQGSLTAAAGVLSLTQSALSHSMKKLETHLGIDIWLREGRSLRLTQAGQYLLALAMRVLPQMDLAEEATDIMLQMVASGCGVAALPRWLALEYSEKMGIIPLRLGSRGIAKQIFLGARNTDTNTD